MAEELCEEQIAEFQEAFEFFDKEKTGALASTQLATVLGALGQKPTSSEIDEMLKIADPKNSGTIDFPDFLKLMAWQINSCPDGEQSISDVFRVFDKDGTGLIHVAELRHVLMDLGEKLTKEEIDRMMKDADPDADGKINYEDFVKLMMS